MEFCSSCGKRLIYQRKSKLKLYCPKCKKDFQLDKNVVNNITQKNRKYGIILIDNKAIKFRTRPTVDTYCKKCEGKKAETWILDLGSEDKLQSIFFRCIKCGNTWREIG